MENRIKGYKAFNVDLTNRYGSSFEVGKRYSVDANAVFGNHGNGFHFCKNIEDTFRYFPAIEEKISVCLVKGTGEIAIYEDEYNGYYDMYSSENIEIIKQLTRDEIIEIGLNLNSLRVCRFIQCFKLNNEEIELFKEKFFDNIRVIQFINYYQLNDKEAFKKI